MDIETVKKPEAVTVSESEIKCTKLFRVAVYGRSFLRTDEFSKFCVVTRTYKF